MKIGFHYTVLTGMEYVTESNEKYSQNIKKSIVSDDAAKLLKALVIEGHELFIITSAPDSCNENDRVKYKKLVLKQLKKSGSPECKVAVICEHELIQAIHRNHIMIYVSSDEVLSLKVSEFTGAIYFSPQMNCSLLLKEIKNCSDKYKQPLLSSDKGIENSPSQEKRWLNYYRESDLKWSDERMSPYDRLVSSNLDWQDEIAMEFYGTKITYSEFFERITTLSEVLLSSGIRKGVRVPLVIVNTPESIITLYALFRIKATIIPIFPLLTPEDLSYKLEHIIECNKSDGITENYLFISDLVYGRFKTIIPEDFHIIVLSVTESMPKHLALAFRYIVMPKLGIKPVKYSDKLCPFKSFFNQNKTHFVDLDTTFTDDYAAVQLYTGGTISPKTVLLSEGNIDAASRQFYNDRFDFRRGDKIAAFMPLNHSFGLIIGTHVAATLGVNLNIIMKIDFKRLDKLFLKDKVNIFGGIPNMFPAIRNNKRMKNADLSHVKYILSGGAPIGAEEKHRTTEFFKNHHSNAELHDGYGLTESSGGIIYDGIPNIGSNIKIVEFETTTEIGYEEIGELCLSGQQIMIGYDNEKISESALRKHDDGELWFHTGDSAIIHTDGKVEIIGRMDRMIKVNGEQVILDDLEELLNTLDFVEQSIVVKKKDDKRGYVPVAFVRLKQGEKWNDDIKSEIENLYEKKMTAFSRPRATQAIEKFPVTNVGKVDYLALEKMAESQDKGE